jgi:hypothetical protein
VSGASRDDLHQHTTGFLTYFVSPQGFVGRGSESLARPQAEVSAMPRTNDLTGFHLSFSERLAVVGATVFYGVNLQSAAYDNHWHAVDLDRQRLHLTNGLAGTYVNPLR